VTPANDGPVPLFVDVLVFLFIVVSLVGVVSILAPAPPPSRDPMTLGDCVSACLPGRFAAFERDEACYCDNFTMEAR
jgi:hypothetical protein